MRLLFILVFLPFDLCNEHRFLAKTPKAFRFFPKSVKVEPSVSPFLTSSITPTQHICGCRVVQHRLLLNLHGYETVRPIVWSIQKQLLPEHHLPRPRYPINRNPLIAQLNLWLCGCRVVHLTYNSLTRASLSNQSPPRVQLHHGSCLLCLVLLRYMLCLPNIQAFALQCPKYKAQCQVAYLLTQASHLHRRVMLHQYHQCLLILLQLLTLSLQTRDFPTSISGDSPAISVSTSQSNAPSLSPLLSNKSSSSESPSMVRIVAAVYFQLCYHHGRLL